VTRFVIDSGTTLQLARVSVMLPEKHKLHAPTLWRSETLSKLYEAVRQGRLTHDAARDQLAYINGLKIRILGDAVLRRRAWRWRSNSAWRRPTRPNTSRSRNSRSARS
jgi:hypothetical protein